MKRLILSIVVLSVLLSSFSSCASKSDPQSKPAKNIILIIGDGMGVDQLYSAYVGLKGTMNAMRMRELGFSITYSSSDFITDSGAGGTALATGKKTYNGAIGVGPDSLPLVSILEYAEQAGKATGLISTSAITHATPASFIAHQKSRNYYEAIAADFLKTDIDVFIGGGLNNFAHRSDSLDLTVNLKEKGYPLVYQLDELKNVSSGKMAALLAPSHLKKAQEGRGDYLSVASLKAIELLNQDTDGFFLMIEGSMIDWGGHDNDTDYIVNEMIDLDNALGKVLDFAESNGETLVIFTADHETGGMSITGGSIENGMVEATYGTGGHTATMVPVLAYGPQADAFKGILQNTQIFDKMYDAFNFQKNTGSER